jgi:hypothetical protein
LSNLQTIASGYDRTVHQRPRSEYFPFVHSPVEADPKSDLLSDIRSSQARLLRPLVEGPEQRYSAIDGFVFAEVLAVTGSRQIVSKIVGPAKQPSLLGAPQDFHPIPEDARVEVLDFAAIQEAAHRRDVRSFIAAVQGVNWGKRSVGELNETIEQALSLGAFVIAHQLAVEGAQQHGDNPLMKRLARILAPAKIVRADLPADPGVLQNHEWLKKHASEYREQWIAVENGKLLFSGDSITEVTTKLGGRKGVLVMRVP